MSQMQYHALETHEHYCYKLSAKDKETRVKSLYEHVEDCEKQKKLDEIDDKKKDRGRSRTPKKEAEIGKRKRTATNQSPQKGKTSEIKKPATKKQKAFTNKPVMKKYPLQGNKEVEDAEKLLAKYKTTNKKLVKSQGKEQSSTDVSRSLDELDDTKNDSNYDPNKSTSGSSDKVNDNETPLPTIRRPKTQSMKTETLENENGKGNGDNLSDAFEIIKSKRKNADNKEDTIKDEKKKKPRSTTNEVPKSTQKSDEKKEISEVKKSQISVKKQLSCIGGVTTRSGASKMIQSRKTEEISDGNNSEDEVTVYNCNLCDQTFKYHSQYKTHKINCTKIPKKFVCPKCSKGFTAKYYLTQHFDFKNTYKLKKYYCKPCNKYFELEKTMKEHNRRLHTDGDYKYLCDFCSRGFWHLQEFKLHHAGHTGLKPYKCGQCEVALFADGHRLNNHLKTCGKMNSYECNQCGKMYSDQKSLSTHISDTHNKTERRCEICPNAIYTSEGGYNTHMRNKHKIGRNGKKLQEVLME